MIRHKGFRSVGDLRRFLEAIVPSDVYYSAAYYERPEENMEAKGWLGADLIFDVDADHIETPCKNDHDSWTCLNCGTKEKGIAPEKCTKCGSQRFEEKTWLCENCLEAAKAETLKLTDILMRDFGLTGEEVITCFSGHRGYHVHIESEIVRQLDQLARKEIVDFIRGTGLDAGYHGLHERTMGVKKVGRIIVGPDLRDPSWRGRLARGVYDFLANAPPEQLENISGMRRTAAKSILEHREMLLKAWRTKAPWDSIRGLGIGAWKKLIDYAVKLQAANVDSVVTTDLHRLIRLPATIHGKTGLKVVVVPIGELEAFDPLKESIAFTEGTMKIHVAEAPKFRLGDQVYGPFKERTVELPTAAAMILLCKKTAYLR